MVTAAALTACNDGGTSPTSPSAAGATVQFDYRASTTVSPDLPPSTQACVSGVGRTHIHPSWRSFNRIDMQAAGTDLWQITFTDVPIAVRLSIRVSDPNVCAENATGAATQSVFANNVPLVDVVPTPGTGRIGPYRRFSDLDLAARVTGYSGSAGAYRDRAGRTVGVTGATSLKTCDSNSPSAPT